MKQESIVGGIGFEFAVEVIRLCRRLSDKKEFILSNQLLRSATSIGANIQEASAAQSRRDFISKMSIASKEARETRYWLQLLQATQSCEIDYKPYIEKVEILVRMLTKIVKTTTENLKQRT